MTIDGFLTFLALLVAVYAVIPRVSRRTIDLKLGLIERIVILTSLLIALGLEFYPTLKAFLKIPSFGLGRVYLTPQNAAFVVLIVSGIFVAFSIRYKSIPPRRLVKLQRLVETLVEAEMFADLIDEVLSPSMNIIYNTAQRSPARTQERTAQEQAALDILRIISLSPRIVSFIAAAKPYFALVIMRMEQIYEVHEFTEMYLTNLIANEHSVLYFEIKQNQNLSSHSGYYFPPHNRLLHFLFADARNAERLEVWRPVGEFMLTGKASPDRKENSGLLNRQMRDFHENGRWTHPLFIGIRFFDLMVVAALHQNIQWHMWLYYYRYLTDMLINNLDAQAPDMEPDAEWPTVGYFLIYEMFNAMRNWILAVENLPSKQENIVMQNTRFEHANGNIPKTTILVMATCLKMVIISDNILDKFKRYVLDILLTLLKDTKRVEKLRPYSEMILNALAAGDFGRTSTTASYHARLLQLLDGADVSVWEEAKAVKEAVRRESER